MKKFLMGAAALAACTSMLLADRITLSDGSVINGQIKSISGGNAVIETAFAGEITVAQDQILRMTTDGAISAANASGEHFTGTLDTQGEQAGALKLQVSDIAHLWTAGMEDPTLPQSRKWNGEFSADINGKTGNTEKFNGGAGLKLGLTGPEDALLLAGSLTYERENGNLNTEKYLANADYERKILETANAWYVKGEYEKQRTSGIRHRVMGGAGYGFYAIDKERTKLRFRAGLTANSRKNTDDTTNDYLGIDASAHFEQAIDEWGKLVSDLAYQPSTKDFADYRIYHESALDIPLLIKQPISLRLGVTNEYYSKVVAGKERLDTTYFAKIVYKWK